MPAVSSGRVWFVARRFERLRDLLFEFGYALDPSPRDPNEWHELHLEDPPTGLVRLKGIRLSDPEAEDSDFDPQITFSIHELWSSDPVEGATVEQGFFLAAHSYHAHHHGVDQRWDFDPARHLERPYHWHPPGQPAQRLQSGGPSVREALASFDRWISAQRSESG